MHAVNRSPTSETLIIGGGIVGLTLAHEVRSRGRSVTLLDAGPDHRSPSRGNAGQIAPGHPPIPSPAVPPRALRMMLDQRSPLHIPPRPSLSLVRWLFQFRLACAASRYEHNMKVLAELSHISRDGFDRLSDELGPASTLAPIGVADIWQSPEGEAEAEDETRWMERLGFDTEVLTGDALRSRDPAWGPKVRGAVLHTDGIAVDPAKLCDAMRARVDEMGVERHRATVTGLARTSRGWVAKTHRRGDFESHQVVLAAGVWSVPLARMLGVRISMQPAKGYHHMIRMPGMPTTPGVLREPKVGITPMGSLLRVAGTLELSGFNHRFHPARVAQLLTGASDFLPGIGHAKTEERWCGLRPCTPSGIPIIGRASENAWVATGHGMMGVTLAPGTASLIADDLDGVSLPPWAAAFQPQS